MCTCSVTETIVKNCEIFRRFHRATYHFVPGHYRRCRDADDNALIQGVCTSFSLLLILSTLSDTMFHSKALLYQFIHKKDIFTSQFIEKIRKKVRRRDSLSQNMGYGFRGKHATLPLSLSGLLKENMDVNGILEEKFRTSESNVLISVSIFSQKKPQSWARLTMKSLM